MQTGGLEEVAVKLLEPGDMFGDYTVEKLLGQGGMGAVHLMRTSDGTLYAVKVMDAEAAEKNQDFLKRFLREGEFAVRIRHPNLIAVHRVGKDERTGLCYLAMDYMPGGFIPGLLVSLGSCLIFALIFVVKSKKGFRHCKCVNK